jgi:hypothetical protein
MTDYQREQEALENAFVRQLLIKYNIKEVTTQKQAINGTREFEFPVPCYTKQRLEWFKSKNYDLNEIPRLRIAVFKSGYVRKQNGCYTPYQLNKQYKQEQRTTFLIDGKLETRRYMGLARAIIWSNLARLNYMLEYYLKNYKQNTNKAR